MAAENMSNTRRDFLEMTLLGIGAFTMANRGEIVSASTDDRSPTSEIKSLFPEGAPAAANGYSPGIVAQGKRVVFVSGQGPEDLKADMETQIRQTFDRIGMVLKAGGASFENVVFIRVYFVHLLRDLPIYRKVRLDYLKEPFPASTALGTTELAIPGLEIEIEAVAIV
ncbi:MAG: Rid family hydrolase [Planctomycetota bacterium]|nr:Rid family hydrolase [Planctomycetota bacterium]MDA1212850.1 Rid family hydrolase [Planctomycetota bacterium]